MIRTSRDLLPLELKLSIGTFSGVEWSFAERADSSFSPKGPAAVRHLRLRPGVSLDAVVREMSGTRVLGGGRIGEATDVVAEMFREPSYTNFLTIAGPMVPAGFRLLFGDLIDRGFLDALVTTGANLTHDVIESLGLRHYQGSFHADDRKLIRAGYSRIADIFVKETSFEKLDKTVRKFVSKIPVAERKNIDYSDLLTRLGVMVNDEDSILTQEARTTGQEFTDQQL